MSTLWNSHVNKGNKKTTVTHWFLMSLWLDKLQKCWFVTRLVYHNLCLKNSSLNCVNRCYPQISPTKLRLEYQSTRYSTRVTPQLCIYKLKITETEFELEIFYGPLWHIGFAGLGSNNKPSPFCGFVTMLMICHSMTLAVEPDIKPQQHWPLKFVRNTSSNPTGDN